MRIMSYSDCYMKKRQELMDECSWIRGWIESQDEFLSKLAEVSGVENRTYNLTAGKPYPPFSEKNRIVLRILRMRVIPYE